MPFFMNILPFSLPHLSLSPFPPPSPLSRQYTYSVASVSLESPDYTPSSSELQIALHSGFLKRVGRFGRKQGRCGLDTNDLGCIHQGRSLETAASGLQFYSLGPSCTAGLPKTYPMRTCCKN